jgi:hypothetical protein
MTRLRARVALWFVACAVVVVIGRAARHWIVSTAAVLLVGWYLFGTG